jgi:hypothetical protein
MRGKTQVAVQLSPMSVFARIFAPWLELASCSGTDTPDTAGFARARACRATGENTPRLTDDANVGFRGTMGVITALEFLQHFVA